MLPRGGRPRARAASRMNAGVGVVRRAASWTRSSANLGVSATGRLPHRMRLNGQRKASDEVRPVQGSLELTLAGVEGVTLAEETR